MYITSQMFTAADKYTLVEDFGCGRFVFIDFLLFATSAAFITDDKRCTALKPIPNAFEAR